MLVPKPLLPPYDVDAWQKKPFPERLKMVCQAWAIQGYGTPLAVYLVYVVKIVAYVGGFFFFCARAGLGEPAEFGSWWFELRALQIAVLWSLAWEGLGFGCGSGPLTGRYFPPLGGVLYFLRPGTTKMPLFPGIPLLGGQRRTGLDVVLYAAHYGFLFRALMAPELNFALLAPMAILLPVLALTDKTIFLASRGEHYFAALVCFLFADQALAGNKLVWLSIWLWAATSKLTHHFPSVVSVMTSNSPVLRFGWLRKRMYRDYPNDLRPSALTHRMAHMGTVIEFTFPLVLLLSPGGPVTVAGLVVMLGFHIYITSNVPMAVPIEWNVIMVYGAFLLFGHHQAVSVLDVAQAPLLLLFLGVVLVAVPIAGNVAPKHVSFLSAMRYYAGNWAYSVWLFRGDSSKKLDQLTKWSPRVQDQLAMFYDEQTTTAVLSKVVAFRAMHLHGRALQQLLPKAVDDIDAYEWLDGELVAGVVLGWNFGDGHLHDQQLLDAVQAQCGFEPGELRGIFVESQPLGGSTLAWTIADAATGVVEAGEVPVAELRELLPWPPLEAPAQPDVP